MANKILVAYYSQSGNTKRLAQAIATNYHADLHEINEVAGTFPDDMYATDDVFKQQLNDHQLPALASQLTNASQYDLILIGGPVWDATVSSPVRTFINQLAGFTGQVADFSSAFSQTGAYEQDFGKLARQAGLTTISNGLHVNGSRVSTGQLQKWRRELDCYTDL